MSHVNFKKLQCRASLSLEFSNVACRILNKAMSHVIIIFSPCRMSPSPMSHVDIKKRPCRSVDFNGLGSSTCSPWSPWKLPRIFPQGQAGVDGRPPDLHLHKVTSHFCSQEEW